MQRHKDRQAGLQVASRRWQVEGTQIDADAPQRRFSQIFVMLSDRRERHAVVFFASLDFLRLRSGHASVASLPRNDVARRY